MKEGKQTGVQTRFSEQEEFAEAKEMENLEMSDDKAGGEKSPSVSRSRLRKESIRGHPDVMLKHRNRTGRAERKDGRSLCSERAETPRKVRNDEKQWKIFGKRLKQYQWRNRR